MDMHTCNPSRSDVQGRFGLQMNWRLGYVSPCLKKKSSGDDDVCTQGTLMGLALHVTHCAGGSDCLWLSCILWKTNKTKRASVLCMSFGICKHTFFLMFSKYVWIFGIIFKVVWCIVLYHQKTILFSVKHYMSYLNSTGGAGLAFSELLSTWGFSQSFPLEG